ncbi:hypothetical protein C8N46_101717 [Kordia periserrulae]|uniref:Uncharacterized protein n=1 Tax=Kordia periserrulae TaxID=701523 RepID=A0A2T6C727_9FLAO|nr:hypothetical protein [Kordia periserrulae]PTX64107.1 hypothetical protein C8N46_101717 [Kordia periserrulae]
MSQLNFGVFNDFWDKNPNHLPFLSLHYLPNISEGWGLYQSIEKLDVIIEENDLSGIIEGIKLLLKSENWRPHLVASLAILKIKKDEQIKLKSLLWERIRKGSWVSPQILVILSIIDIDFKKIAKEIYENGFQIVYSKMSSVEHHSARGPAGLHVDNQKVIASVEYLLHGTINDSFENDCGGSITKSWKKNLMDLIENNKFTIKS